MNKILHFWSILILDTIGILFIIAALLTGWLPGPGGIPLFLIGLSLLAINHTWAQRYIDIVKKYAHKIGEVVFIENRSLQLLYDLMAPIVVALGTLLLYKHTKIWMIPLGIFLIFFGLTFFLGNRERWTKLKKHLSK